MPLSGLELQRVISRFIVQKTVRLRFGARGYLETAIKY